MKTAYRVIGLLLAVTGITGVVINLLLSLCIKDQTLPVTSAVITLVISSLLLVLHFITEESSHIKLAERTITINYRQITMMVQFLSAISLSSFMIIRNDSSPYAITLIVITGLMGIKYHIIHYTGLLIGMGYYMILFGIRVYLYRLSVEDILDLAYTVVFFLIIFLLFLDELKLQFDLTSEYRTQAVEVRQRLAVYEQQTLDPAQLGLTPREMEVLSCLCVTNGTNKEMGLQLGIQPQTVKTHLRNIFDKAGVDDRHQLFDMCRVYFLESQSEGF